MRAIGLRASPTVVTYAVVDGADDKYEVTSLDVVEVPRALLAPNQLHFMRTVLLDVMEEFEVTRAGLRIAENTARSRSVFRDNLEGVIQELLASSSVEWYFAGQIARIASMLGYTDRTVIRRMVDGDETPPSSTGWSNYSKEQREAFLVACAAIKGSGLTVASSPLAGVGGKS